MCGESGGRCSEGLVLPWQNRDVIVSGRSKIRNMSVDAATHWAVSRYWTVVHMARRTVSSQRGWGWSINYRL